MRRSSYIYWLLASYLSTGKRYLKVPLWKPLVRLTTLLLCVTVMRSAILFVVWLSQYAVTVTIETKDRFPVYWNVPSQKCYKNGIKIPVTDFGIRENEGQAFFGNQIVIFYEYSFGTFPYFANGNASQPINGGLPQLCKLSNHLVAVADDIRTRIPDETFDGVAVIDFEEWRPRFNLNWGAKRVYQRESIRVVKEREPSISEKAAKLIAQKEFDKAARKIFLETIRLGMRMRPYAKWGFYGFPYCNYDAGSQGEFTCTDHFQEHNNQLSFIMTAGNALFPSIYLGEHEPKLNHRYIQAILAESRRLAALVQPPLPIYPYTKFEYNPYDIRRTHEFYEKKDLCNSIKQSADAGAAGIILWSTSYKMNTTRCNLIKDFVEKSLGPTVALVKKRVEKCSRRLCHGRGYCVLSGPSDRCQFQMRSDSYRCECDSQYRGASCKQHSHFPWLYALDNSVRSDNDEEETAQEAEKDNELHR